MTKSKKKTLILLTLVIFFIFSNISKNFITNKQTLEFNEKYQVQIILSGFWDLTGSPIYIDDLDPNYNWSKTALNYAWCSGSGSWADPYIIENVTINGQGSSSCIEIRYSDAFFIIRNCSLYNSGSSFVNASIKLYYVDNGKIMNNNCSDNNVNGIYLSYSNNNTLSVNNASSNDEYGIHLGLYSVNNTLSGNIANNNDFGIYLDYCNNNNLSGNIANNNIYGTYLRYSNNNTLSGNTVNNNYHGIYLDSNNDNNTLSGNKANNNNNGIYLRYSDNNTLSGNNASNNDEYGIYLRNSDNNTLSGNTASNNDEYGIYLRDSEDNTLSGNLMNFCGISLSGSLAEMASHIIDDTNLVNNKPVYYYANEISLRSNNFSGAGQIILINSNNSIISGLNISDGSGIHLYYCVNNTLSGNTASNNKDHGIYLRYSNNNTLSGNTANNNSCGIDLYYSDYNTLSVNNASNNDEYGVYLEYSHQNDIFSNNFTNNVEGIRLRHSNDNFFVGNNVTKNVNGIYLENSDSNKILSNIVNNNTGYNVYGSDALGNGIILEQSEYNNLTQNIICFNDFAGIYLDGVINVSLTKNNMNNCGLHILNSMGNFESYHIDKSNTVNNKPIYFYINKSNLKKNNFSNAGQVILVNCNNSVISDQNFAYSTNGIYFSSCNNNSIFNNTFDFILNAGISLNFYGYNNTIIKNNFTNGGLYGISIRNCNYNNLTNNKIESTIQGIDLYNCNDTIISYNNISNSQMAGIYCRPGSEDMWEIPLKNVFITGNKMEQCGLVISHSEDYKTNYVIDKTNLVNDKPIYYYIDRNYLSQADFANAGQIYLINCNHTSFSNLDCSFSSAGVLLSRCNNNSISNINCSGNTYNGFGLSRCNNNNLTRIVSNSGFYMGMQLAECYNNFISDCNVSNSYYGMYMLLCYNSTVMGGSFNNNSHSIYISSCSNSIIKNNNISNNKKGTLPSSSEPSGGNGIMFYKCNFNNFTNNYIINNEGSGIILSDNNNNNTFSRNVIKNNTEFGVIIESDWSVNHNNSYILNDFINNGVNAVDLGIDNRWDDGITGNYWDDYNGLDLDPKDGIGDSSFLVNGTAGVFDTKPLMYPTYEDTDGDGLINYEEYILGDDNYRTNVTNSDSDYDVLSDYWEWGNLTDPWDPDCDDDNLSDWEEITGNNNTAFGNQATNPWNLDTDGDGLNDTAECTGSENLYQLGAPTNPNDLDTDGDGLNDTAECFGTLGYITNANLPDSDFDNMPDGWEVFNSLNPLYDDAFNDTDNDLLLNLYEYHNGTNPQNNDTESDGMPDGWEVINGLLPLTDDSTGDPDLDLLLNLYEYRNGTNPWEPDSDFDNMPDGWEVFNSLNPLYDDAFNDTDNDLLLNLYEYLNGTDPNNDDTDYDNMPDGWEVFYSLDPLSDDAFNDTDNDLLLNLYEYLNGTNPQNDDTDGDTFLDGTEVNLNTNPLNSWWYPMPNLEIIDFKAKAVEIGKPFTLNFTITNNGIWRAENVFIIIRIELGNLTLWDNFDDPIDLEVDETYQDLIQITTGVTASGGLVMELILDPLNLINETYSSKDGSLREDGEDNNTEKTELQIVGELPFDPFWLILIILAIVAISTGIGLFIVFRPKIKRKIALKRQLAIAKRDIKNFEITMHSFIKVQLKGYYKSSWWEEGIPGYVRNTIDSKIQFEKPGKEEMSIDKIDILEFSHIISIITESNNWEHIFSETFPDKNVVEENIEKLRVFKGNLAEGNVTLEEMANYPLYIHAIRNYFTRGFNIFLSYSTLDTDYFKIEEVAKRLESYPRIDKVFFWEADSGESIVTYMERTLRLSKIFVFFCSENSMKSKAVEDEWQAAFQMRKKGLMKIVPIFEKEDLIPFLLMPLLNVKYTKDDFDGFIQKLYDEILR